MEAKDFVDELVARARKAQEEYEKFSQEQADAIVRACAKAVYDNAEYLARLAVDETRMGVYEHKIQKNKGKAKVIWNSLKGKKSVGILSRNEETGITEIARPVGVVGAVTPCTNPVVTPMCNAMFALKGLNAIIIGPHPRSKNTSYETVRLMNEAIAKLGAPKNLIQIIEEPTVELSSALMHAVDVVVATGGMPMVRSAYSSGKPAYGVGAGNVQCIFDRGIDLEKEIPMAVEGRAFDNGIICSGEQTGYPPGGGLRQGCFDIREERLPLHQLRRRGRKADRHHFPGRCDEQEAGRSFRAQDRRGCRHKGSRQHKGASCPRLPTTARRACSPRKRCARSFRLTDTAISARRLPLHRLTSTSRAEDTASPSTRTTRKTSSMPASV